MTHTHTATAARLDRACKLADTAAKHTVN